VLSDLKEAVYNMKFLNEKNNNKFVKMPYIIMVTDCINETQKQMRDGLVDEYLSAPLTAVEMNHILAVFA
jgi:hypothetical protein